MKDTGIKFETLRKGFNLKKVFIGLVVIVAIGSVVILKGSKANYTYQEIIPFAEGVVRIRKSDLNLMAVNLQKSKGSSEYTPTTNVPTSGYIFNTTKSYCTVDNGTSDVTDSTIPMEYENGAVNIKVKKKGTRCYLYFDIATSPKTMKQIITDNYKTVLTRTSFMIMST